MHLILRNNYFQGGKMMKRKIGINKWASYLTLLCSALLTVSLLTGCGGAAAPQAAAPEQADRSA